MDYSGYTISGLSTGWHYISVVGNNTNSNSTFYIDGLSVGTISWKSNDTMLILAIIKGVLSNGDRLMNLEFQRRFVTQLGLRLVISRSLITLQP